jgi:hypothetical protein
VHAVTASIIAALLGGLCLALALPSAALAMDGWSTSPHAPPAAVYGGRTAQEHPMSLRLTRDGNRLRDVFVHVDADICSSSGVAIHQLALHLLSRPTIGVRSDGSFADRRHVNGITQDGRTGAFAVALKGKVGKTKAAGTFHVSGALSDSDGTVVDRCESGEVRWTLRRANVYGGATADDRALSIRVNRSRTRLKSFFIDFPVVCNSRIYYFSLEHRGVAVRRHGNFAKHGLSGLQLPGLQGSSVSGQYWLRGKLGARRAHGTYRAVGTTRLTDGTTLTCDTGLMRWSARRA